MAELTATQDSPDGRLKHKFQFYDDYDDELIKKRQTFSRATSLLQKSTARKTQAAHKAKKASPVDPSRQRRQNTTMAISNYKKEVNW